MNLSDAELAACIQSTIIRADVTAEQVTAHCRDCLELGFDAAMVPGIWVAETARLLRGSRVKVASCIDFPLGIATTAGRAAEAQALVAAGARELDIMIQLGYLKSGMFAEFAADLRAVVEAARPARVKVMLELPLLDPALRERAVALAVAAGVHWLKNASGGAVGVATPEDIRFLRERAPVGVGVKASGGIKTREQVMALLAAGAELVGTSSGVQIVSGRPPESRDDY